MNARVRPLTDFGTATDELERWIAAGFTKIPLVLRRSADLDTPLGLYRKLVGSQNAHSFLLESVTKAQHVGRYSFIGLPAHTVLSARGRLTEVHTDGELVERVAGNPLDFLEQFQRRGKVAVPPGLPRFCGGLCGYFGYDCIRYIEPRLARDDKPDPLATPDITLLVCDELAMIDNVTSTLTLIVYADTSQPQAVDVALHRLAELNARVDSTSTPLAVPPCTAQATQRHFQRSDFLSTVEQAKRYIEAGDMMQVQIGQRLSKPFAGAPLSLYRALRACNPSPYMYYFDLGAFQIVGASPETLVRQEQCAEGRKVTIRPLAGTRPRGATPEQDCAIEAELLRDPKERAEHVMLIDLARNDIGRIARTGTVKVTEAFNIERYSHVMHIISNVEGILEPGIGNLDVLRATLPAGTLTGAPKIRAMEIIDAAEPVKRGIYGGAVGYLSYNGDMDVAIAIRTAIVKDGWLHVQASAGIVADSLPELEWQETEAKARALLTASEWVERGF